MVKRFPVEEVQKDLDYCYENLFPGVESIVLHGFCWGSWLFHAHKKDPRVKGGINSHPALGVEEIFGGKDLDLVKKNSSIPQLYLPCSDDNKNLKKGEAECVVSNTFHFKNRNHGFVTQGDITDESLKADVEKTIALTHSFTAYVSMLD